MVEQFFRPRPTHLQLEVGLELMPDSGSWFEELEGFKDKVLWVRRLYDLVYKQLIYMYITAGRVGTCRYVPWINVGLIRAYILHVVL